VVARDVNELHGDNNLNKQNSLTEKGQTVPGSGDPVNTHDILTGSSPDGRALLRTKTRHAAIGRIAAMARRSWVTFS
jgi:hypothetical protein